MELCLDDFIGLLERSMQMFLGTSHAGRVSVRPVGVFNDGMTIYVMTAEHSVKANHMRENPNVGACIGDYIVEGEATYIGTVDEPDNRPIAASYREKHHDTMDEFGNFSHGMNQLFAIRPTLIQRWVYQGEEPYEMLEWTL